MKNNVLVFNIREIGDMQSQERRTGERVIKIPALQRRLVWKPRQVELLWDSILRGFPIGSFTLSESDSSDRGYTKDSSKDNTLYLIDGLQRFNSIGIGYDDPVWSKESTEEPTTVLWIDIANEYETNSSRKFWIRATTKYHPWGYENNDNCNTLSASDRREAMECFGFEGKKIYEEFISLKDTWPHKAKLPIPLHLFLRLDVTTDDNILAKKDFSDRIIVEIEEKAPDEWKKKFWGEENKKTSRNIIEELYDVFNEVRDYSISGTILRNEVINKDAKEGNLNNEKSTDLEVLFNRLGTGGSQITQSELMYSAITAYWGAIKSKNEDLAKEYMPPENLVILAFRLALTHEDANTNLASTPSIPKIRKLKNDKEFKNILIKLYEERLFEILKKVDDMISGDDVDKTPTILKLDIYKNHQELMLLLMYIADKNLDLENNFVRALAFYITWFGLKGKENKIILLVFQHIKIANSDNAKDSILKALFECVYNEHIMRIPNLNNLNVGEKLTDQEENVLNHLKYNHNFLFFAQRSYLNNTFKNYKPVTSFDWQDHNRPWDIDHIVPQSWINARGGKYKAECMDYLNSVGNLAPIPFEENRAKNADANWDYYNNNSDKLYFAQDWISGINNQIRHNKESTEKFIQFCKTRMKSMYNNCNEAIFKHINLDIKLTPENKSLIPKNALKRRDFIEYLRKNEMLKDFRLYYVDEYSSTDIEMDVTKIIDWSRRWISLGYIVNGFMVSITSSDGVTYEIGLRTHPNDKIRNKEVFDNNKDLFDRIGVDGLIESQNDWWYWEKDFTENVEKEFMSFLEKCNISL